MAKTPYTPRFTAREDNLQGAGELLLKFVQAIAKADVRKDRAKVLEGDWRKKPRKQVLTPPKGRE